MGHSTPYPLAHPLFDEDAYIHLFDNSQHTVMYSRQSRMLESQSMGKMGRINDY